MGEMLRGDVDSNELNLSSKNCEGHTPAGSCAPPPVEPADHRLAALPPGPPSQVHPPNAGRGRASRREGEHRGIRRELLQLESQGYLPEEDHWLVRPSRAAPDDPPPSLVGGVVGSGLALGHSLTPTPPSTSPSPTPTAVSKILSWKNEVIKTSLLKLPTKELEVQAIQCFRNVTGFMGDRDSKKEETGHAEKLLKTCLHAPEELRDEVFCQIIKQTTNNPSPESALKGWMLLGVCTGAFSPSKEFEPYLLSYCEAHKEDAGGVAEYCKYTMGRILKTGQLGPRREVPTGMEIEAAKVRHGHSG